MIKRDKIAVVVSVDRNDGYVETTVWRTLDQAVEFVKGLVEESSDETEAELETTLMCVEREIADTGRYEGDSTVYYVKVREVNG